MKHIVYPVLIGFLLGCTSSSNKDIAVDTTTDSETDEIVTPSGLRYTMVTEGSGPRVENGKQITTHCILTLEDGSVVWSSRDDGQEFVFVQGETPLIAGFTEILSYMKEGDRLNVFIPSELGYGSRGRNPIPPNTNLLYDIEVLKVEDRPDL